MKNIMWNGLGIIIGILFCLLLIVTEAKIILIYGHGHGKILPISEIYLPTENEKIDESFVKRFFEELYILKIIVAFIVIPFNSIITSIVVGLICATKPWLCGMIGISPLVIIILSCGFLFHGFISFIKELLYLCLILSIPLIVSPLVFKTKIRYICSKRKELKTGLQ